MEALKIYERFWKILQDLGISLFVFLPKKPKYNKELEPWLAVTFRMIAFKLWCFFIDRLFLPSVWPHLNLIPSGLYTNLLRDYFWITYRRAGHSHIAAKSLKIIYWHLYLIWCIFTKNKGYTYNVKKIYKYFYFFNLFLKLYTPIKRSLLHARRRKSW